MYIVERLHCYQSIDKLYFSYVKITATESGKLQGYNTCTSEHMYLLPSFLNATQFGKFCKGQKFAKLYIIRRL